MRFETDSSPDVTGPRHPRRTALVVLVAVLIGAVGVGCNDFDDKSIEQPRVEVLFNSTGTRSGNDYDLKPSELLVERIDAADSEINVTAYGFDKRNLVHSLITAYDRGVDLRFVGSTSHVGEYGYQQMYERNVPTQVGNEFHIMHNKFIVVDNRFVFLGTGNLTPTGFKRNTNNWLWIESGQLARDFNAEFEQMFQGEFSSAKDRDGGPNTYQIGDTKAEVYFAPQEQSVSRIIEEVEKADDSIHFQIFAFTKNEVGSAFIDKHREFARHNDQVAEDDDEIPENWREELSPRDWPKKVVGVLDRSQVHGNGQYHEAYRLSAMGVPMRLDGNEASRLPGDYQAGGGRLHTKTMILDAGTEDARVITGSFNWSSSATITNDEVMMILHGERIADRYMQMYDSLWQKGRGLAKGVCSYMKRFEDAKGNKDLTHTCAPDVEPGDVVFSEIHWDGWNDKTSNTDHTDPLDERDSVTNDEFIELKNTTDHPIDLSLWSITNGHDFKVGFPPGTIIHPDQNFLILDHNVVAYSPNTPQRGDHAFQNGDFVLNTANDPRFPRLNIKNNSMSLKLRKVGQLPSEEPIDVAGNSGPPFWGGRDVECEENCDGFEPVYEIQESYSMERKFENGEPVGPGDEPDSWRPCKAEQGGANVNPEFREKIIATPGEENSTPQ